MCERCFLLLPCGSWGSKLDLLARALPTEEIESSMENVQGPRTSKRRRGQVPWFRQQKGVSSPRPFSWNWQGEERTQRSVFLFGRRPFSSLRGKLRTIPGPLCCPRSKCRMDGCGGGVVSLSLGFILSLGVHLWCEYTSVHPGTGGMFSLLCAGWGTLNKTLG